MKNLKDYILENSKSVENQNEINEASKEKKITFDFTGLENDEETLKSFDGKDFCTIEDNKLTVTVTADNCDKLDTVQDILQQYAETLRSSTKNSSDEQYAQKTHKFADKVAEFNDVLDEFQNPGEEE